MIEYSILHKIFNTIENLMQISNFCKNSRKNEKVGRNFVKEWIFDEIDYSILLPLHSTEISKLLQPLKYR